MKRELEGLRWRPSWVSHLGCVKGCLDYLGLDISRAWLYGGTGHAFVINMHEELCPSGPTAWNKEMLFRLAPNLGYKASTVFGDKRQAADFASKQEEAWGFVRARIDEGIPCYGWELAVPEYYTIFGYDDVGYYYSGPGCDAGAGPKPWREVAMSEIGVLEVCSVQPCSPAPDEKAVKDALAFAIEHAESPEKWIFPRYQSGPKGFDLWAEALEYGTAGRFGQGYNAAVWTECREAAVAFLEEAKERLSGKADSMFDEAIAHYSVVHLKLAALVHLHPFGMPKEGEETQRLKSPEGAALVREAAGEERKGLHVLAELVKCL